MTNDKWKMKNEKWQFVVGASDFYLSFVICHLVI